MIACAAFRDAFQPGTSDAELLEHVRACDACLDFAVYRDPDILFRAIGGDDLVPPGGVDTFVDDVMREVRLRSNVGRVLTRPARGLKPALRRLAVAATLVAGITSGALYFQSTRHVATDISSTVPRARVLVTRPVVDSYDSGNATIVEVPSADSNVRVVMVFDENLPADL
jgi:hypothetical protein